MLKIFRRCKIEIYQSPDHKFRWRLKALNGEIEADGSQGYSNRSNAHRALKQTQRNMFCAKVVDVIGRIP